MGVSGGRWWSGGAVAVCRDSYEQVENAALKLEWGGLFAANDGHKEEVVGCTTQSRLFRFSGTESEQAGAPSRILSSWSNSSLFKLSWCRSKNLCSSCPISAHPRFLQAQATLLRNTATSWLIFATSQAFDWPTANDRQYSSGKTGGDSPISAFHPAMLRELLEGSIASEENFLRCVHSCSKPKWPKRSLGRKFC